MSMKFQLGVTAAITFAGATVERTPESKALVTFYAIPSDENIQYVTLSMLYFKDEDTAKGFVEKYKDEPEMPSLEKLQ